jgi:hypothetical protein
VILPIVEATAQNETALVTPGFAKRSLICGARDIPMIDAMGMRLYRNISEMIVG